MEIQIYTIIMAIFFDLFFGDPLWFYHPVRFVGFLEIKLEEVFRKYLKNYLFLAGVLLTCILVFFSLFITVWLSFITFQLSVVFGIIFQVVAIGVGLSIKSLTREGKLGIKFLKDNNLSAAKNQVSTIVSRNLRDENAMGVIRALIESLMENLSDGIIAPLFYAFLFGAPGIWFYKTVNTLDSMIGYRTEEYEQFGKFAARLDDVLNFIPARITGFLIVVVSIVSGYETLLALKVWGRDAQKGPSINGGIPIVVFAGAQNIRLGGNCKDKNNNVISIPFVGGTNEKLTVSHIRSALFFIYFVTFLFILCSILMLYVVNYNFFQIFY